MNEFRKSRWFKLVWIAPIVIVVAVAVVLLVQWWRTTADMQSFLTTYPGHYELPEGAPVGFPIWINVLHFLNAFFLVLIIRSGWRVRTVTRPAAFFQRNKSPFKVSQRISIDLWLHLSLDILWILLGVVFYVLLFTTGQWERIIPTSWSVFPNAISAAIQYVSLNWPTEDGWINYNSLQQLAYGAIVFLAAPLAIITGVRMSPFWPKNKPKLDKAYPVEVARAIHLPTMFFFVGFVIVHVFLVLTTGALRNLNHMYAGQESEGSWLGFALFMVSLVLIVAAWIAARPLVLRMLASFTGSVSK